MFTLVKSLIKPATIAKDPTLVVEHVETDGTDQWTDSDASEDSISEQDQVLDKLAQLKVGTAKSAPKVYGIAYRETRLSLASVTSSEESDDEAQSPVEPAKTPIDVVFRPGRLKAPTPISIGTEVSQPTAKPPSDLAQTPTCTQTPIGATFNTPPALKTPQGAKERYANVAPKIPTHVVKKSSTPNTPSSRTPNPVASPSNPSKMMPRPTLASATRARLAHEKNKEN